MSKSVNQKNNKQCIYTLTHLHHLMVQNNLTKTFKVMVKDKNYMWLVYQADAYNGITKLFRCEFRIWRTSEHCYRVAQSKQYYSCRHLSPTSHSSLRFTSAESFIPFLLFCRSEIGADDNGKIIDGYKINLN